MTSLFHGGRHGRGVGDLRRCTPDHRTTNQKDTTQQMKSKHLAPIVSLVLSWLALVSGTHAQNLVTNPGFEVGNTGFTTDYTLWTGGITGQNLYAVTNSPQNVYAGWGSFGDHTTGSGKMLIVDGSTTTGRAFWRETVSVATNTFYLFSAWALKFDSDSPPILYFTVNGIQQGTFYVLPLMPSGWQGYGVTWSSGASNTAVLELRLQSNKAGPGNNIAIDDIALIPYADVPSPVASIQNAVEIGWTSYSGAPYQVFWRSEADTNTWLPLGGLVIGNGTTNYVCDPLATQTRRFYRIAT